MDSTGAPAPGERQGQNSATQYRGRARFGNVGNDLDSANLRPIISFFRPQQEIVRRQVRENNEVAFARSAGGIGGEGDLGESAGEIGGVFGKNVRRQITAQ